MRYKTTTGGHVTADSLAAAALLAAEYGMGDIVAPAHAPKRPVKPMSLNRARAMYVWAHEFPRHGEGWPNGQQERQADVILASANFDPEE